MYKKYSAAKAAHKILPLHTNEANITTKANRRGYRVGIDPVGYDSKFSASHWQKSTADIWDASLDEFEEFIKSKPLETTMQSPIRVVNTAPLSQCAAPRSTTTAAPGKANSEKISPPQQLEFTALLREGAMDAPKGGHR